MLDWQAVNASVAELTRLSTEVKEKEREIYNQDYETAKATKKAVVRQADDKDNLRLEELKAAFSNASVAIFASIDRCVDVLVDQVERGEKVPMAVFKFEDALRTLLALNHNPQVSILPRLRLRSMIVG